MLPTVGFAPASLRRAFFLAGLAVLAAPPAVFPAAPPQKLPELAQWGKPDAAEAARIVGLVRGSGIAGDHYLEFELQALPRRGTETTYRGRYWGSRAAAGAISRIELTDAAGAVHRYLVANGPQPAVWRTRPPVLAAERLGGDELFAPLLPGLELSAFDLQLPYLYWPGPRVERIARLRGRPAYEFLFPAPPGTGGGVGAVRAFLDTQFNAMLQSEVLGADGTVLRSFALQSFKTVGKQPLPKVLDYRNEKTRDKSRLTVVAAALDLALPAGVFEPATLDRNAGVPGSAVRLEP
jgi:hypothetical protein